MYDAFISYSKDDKSIVEAICNYLTNQGVNCFVAYRDIPDGEDYARVIPPAIHDSRMLLAVFSLAFDKSEHTDRELHIAADNKIPILTFRIADDKFTGVKEYFLINKNYIDASFEPGKHFEELLRGVAFMLNKKDVVARRKTVMQMPKKQLSDAEIVCEEGKRLLYNDEEHRDPIKAFYLLTQAASKGLAEAQYELSQCYWNGWGCPQSWDKVRECLSKAAVQGHPKAQRELGRMFHYAIGGKQDFMEASQLYTAAAEAGDGWAAKWLGKAFHTGELGEVMDEKRSKEWYDRAYELLQRQAFEDGDYDAMRIMGFSYLDGEGVDFAPHLGAKWLNMAARLHNAAAYNGIYQCYSKGLGLPLDKERALEMAKIAANLECRTAQNYLAHYYHKLGNDALEMDYRMQAAEGGYAGAQVDLARCFEIGCVPYKQDAEEAERWYSRAIDSGSLEALYLKGQMIEKKENATESEREQAVECYRRAAMLGYVFAWVALANHYFSLKEDKKNDVVAELWYRRYLDLYDRSVANGRKDFYIPNGQGGKKLISFKGDIECAMLVQTCENLSWIYLNSKIVKHNKAEAVRVKEIAKKMKTKDDLG